MKQKKNDDQNQVNNIIPLRALDNRERREQDEQPRKKKRRANSGAITLCVLLIFALIFLLGPMAIRMATGNMRSTGVFQNGLIEESINTEAVVIRYEEVLTGDLAGIGIPTYREGETVPNGATVATVIDSGASGMVDQIRSLNVRISQARDSLLRNADFVNEEVRRIDSEIEAHINDFSNINRSTDLTEYSDIHRNIEILIDQRQDLQNRDSDTTSSYLRQLESQKSELEAAIGNRVENITASRAGVVSYVVDGFESLHTPAGLENISSQRLLEMKDEIRSGNINKTDNCHAKIITGINYYLATSVRYEDIRRSGIDVESTVDVRINDRNITVRMEVYSMHNEGDTVVVVFRANRALAEMTGIRLANIDIILRQVRGIKVPSRALSYINYREMNAQITLVRSGYEHQVEVRLLILSGNYAIIENLNLGTEISIELNELYLY